MEYRTGLIKALKSSAKLFNDIAKSFGHPGDGDIMLDRPWFEVPNVFKKDKE